MTEAHKILAINGIRSTEAAMRSLLKAAQTLSQVGASVADDISRTDHPDLSFSRTLISEAWHTITQEALVNLSKAREQMISAVQASEREKQEGLSPTQREGN